MKAKFLLIGIFLLSLNSMAAFAFESSKEVQGFGSVSAWNGNFPAGYLELAQAEAIEDAKLLCGGEVVQLSQWQGRHYKNGGSDGQATTWTYQVTATFQCIE